MSEIIRDLTEDELTSVAGGDLRDEIASTMSAMDAAKVNLLFDPPRGPFNWLETYDRPFQ